MPARLFGAIGSKLLFLLFLCLLTVLPVLAQTNGNKEDNQQSKQLYEAGLEAYNNGNTDQALKLWFDGYLDARKAGNHDPRLAVSFLQTVAADSITRHYDTASIIYHWGMSTETLEGFTEVLRAEIHRLQILLPSKQYNRLDQKLRKGDTSVAADIRAVWDQGDPSPSTRTNERLIEHWQRVTHARIAFPGNNQTYHTDDRGLTYIRYGPPDKVDKGIISFNTGLIRSDVIEIIESRDFNNQVSVDQSDAIAQAVLSYILTTNIHPGYEIWKYNRQLTKHPSASTDNLLFIFGDGGDAGGFSRQETLADLLPSSVLSESSFRQATVDVPSIPLKINSGLIMQYDILRQLSHIDEHFNLTLTDVESTLFSSRQTLSGSTGRNLKQKQAFDLLQQETIAGPQASSLPVIDLQVETYRFLDEKDRPYHITVLYSFPHKFLAVNQIGYNYRHVFQLSGPQSETVARETELPPITFETLQDNTLLPAQSQFRIPYPADSLTQVFAAEYYIPRDSTDELELTAAGKRTFAPPEEPLSADTGQLEASDLVAGYTAETKPHGYFPFRVAYQNKIPAGQDLMFHFEVYHLQPGSAGIAEFRVVYELKKEGNFVQKVFGGDDQQGRLTLNFETSATRFAENIEVETSELEPGTYTLNLIIKEPSSKRSVKRTLEFEIVQQAGSAKK